MSAYLSDELRRSVIQRADFLCEYCLIHEADVFAGCQVDHVISEKHGGLTEAGNLACACACCNRSKGSDIASIDPASGELTRLFNPRTDSWGTHFQLIGVRIEWRTAIGAVTVRLLRLNAIQRIWEREALKDKRRYPSPAALRRMKVR